MFRCTRQKSKEIIRSFFRFFFGKNNAALCCTYFRKKRGAVLAVVPIWNENEKQRGHIWSLRVCMHSLLCEVRQESGGIHCWIYFRVKCFFSAFYLEISKEKCQRLLLHILVDRLWAEQHNAFGLKWIGELMNDAGQLSMLEFRTGCIWTCAEESIMVPITVSLSSPYRFYNCKYDNKRHFIFSHIKPGPFTSRRELTQTLILLYFYLCNHLRAVFLTICLMAAWKCSRTHSKSTRIAQFSHEMYLKPQPTMFLRQTPLNKQYAPLEMAFGIRTSRHPDFYNSCWLAHPVPGSSVDHSARFCSMQMCALVCITHTPPVT